MGLSVGCVVGHVGCVVGHVGCIVGHMGRTVGHMGDCRICRTPDTRCTLWMLGTVVHHRTSFWDSGGLLGFMGHLGLVRHLV